MEKLKMAHTKQVEEFSTDVQKVLSACESKPLNDTVASMAALSVTTSSATTIHTTTSSATTTTTTTTTSTT